MGYVRYIIDWINRKYRQYLAVQEFNSILHQAQEMERQGKLDNEVLKHEICQYIKPLKNKENHEYKSKHYH